MRNITTFLKQSIKLSIICFAFTSAVNAQNLGRFAGGRSEGLSRASVTLHDAWSAQNNIAGSAFLQDIQIGLSHQNRFLVQEFALSHTTLTIPTKVGSFSATASYFGFDLYNETTVGIGFARTFGKRFSAGLKAQYHSNFTQEATAQNQFFTLGIGLLAIPFDRLRIGLNMYNLNGANVGNEVFETLPTELDLGAAFDINSDLVILAEVNKAIGTSETFAAAFEYKLIEQITLRTGVRFPEVSNSFGLGMRFGSFSADASYSYAAILGSNANLSLQYAF